MMQYHFFTFNPFQENSYLVWDETLDCIIIDPGCSNPAEEDELRNYIRDNKLKPVALINTHCHIDHVLGNKFVSETYNLIPKIHPLEKPLLDAVQSYAHMYGFTYEASPEAQQVLADHDVFRFGKSELKQILAPGHSPGSICFYAEEEQFLIGGDVLFRMSIGRSDLPGGDAKTLLESIRKRIFTLPDTVEVLPGHGEFTTIGFEKLHNPFLSDGL